MNFPLSKTQKIAAYSCQVLAAIIMLQTLFFKISGATESVYIFTSLGMEPWGRYMVGISELVAAILLLIPRSSWLGALMGIGIMGGAIFFHLTTLGISVNGDGGVLFLYCQTVFFCSIVVLYIRRKQIPYLQEWIAQG